MQKHILILMWCMKGSVAMRSKISFQIVQKWITKCEYIYTHIRACVSVCVSMRVGGK